MQQSRKELLLEILNIIKYKDNKEQFIKEFEAMHYLEALVGMLEKIPENLRELLRVKIERGDRTEILKYFSPDEYRNEINKVADNALKEFIKTISPVLNLSQKQTIDQLMHKKDR